MLQVTISLSIVASWLDVAGQWREGVFFPRWARMGQLGIWRASFHFLPARFMDAWRGARLGAAMENGPGNVYLARPDLLSGFAMWRLARESLPDPQAIAAAVIFVVNPYQLVVVYYRSDYAELLASALFPLLVFGALRVVRSSSRQNGPQRNDSRQNWAAVPLLALVFAAIWLSNAPAAVIATYSLVLLIVVGCSSSGKFSSSDGRSRRNGASGSDLRHFIFFPQLSNSAGYKSRK